ncbi:helix-turn-helix domain-containing protein [Bifidobacterium pseudolongum]|uniref:Cryptic prophage protein n=1 Tax=Bifidobacterium pseudolongum subsp. globosum TaxID=1690 RepID=A0A4V1Y4Q0_9BIFI|nr:helix-turn-helix domain-containing protein [Bifidobacterium pseudolongum]RYQ36534.1 cryptic prophage protein [Bifidobacterium pseudolongum subsp. globosum]
MSLRALTWAIYEIGSTLKDASAYRVLLILADNANDEGKGAYPSASTIAEETGMSLRTVRNKLNDLEAAGIIMRGDQALADYLPANRRSVVWDLNLDNNRRAESAPQHTPATTTTRGAKSAPQTDGPDVQQGCNRGATDVQQGCSLSAHNPLNPINPINPREAAREHEPDTDTTQPTSREQALADWAPNSEHEALANSAHADLDAEADKFRCKQLADGRIAQNLDAAFTLWLRRGIEGGYLTRRTNRPSDTTHTPEPHRHTLGCEHVLDLLTPYEQLFDHEGGRGSNPWISARSRLADLLNQGANPDVALADILQEAAA